jgi:hypothetical protein
MLIRMCVYICVHVYMFVYVYVAGVWLVITMLSTGVIGSAVEESGWMGRLIMCLVPTLKSLEAFLIMVPLAVMTTYQALWIDSTVLLSHQVPPPSTHSHTHSLTICSSPTRYPFSVYASPCNSIYRYIYTHK